MLYPAIDHLVKVVDSKYTLVSLAAKRARQIREVNREKAAEEIEFMINDPKSKKYVGVALEEIMAGEVEYELPKIAEKIDKQE